MAQPIPPLQTAQMALTASFTPSRDTAVWLASLPTPPGSVRTPRPVTLADWQLVEQFRLLCTTITALGECERQRLAAEQSEWDSQAASLAPAAAQLSLNSHDHSHVHHHHAPHHHHHHHPHPHAHHHHHHIHHSPQLDASFEFNPSLPSSLHVTLASADAAAMDATQDSIPSLYASIAELENCVLRLSKETAEAQGLQRQLAEQLENRPIPTTVDEATLPADREAIAKVLSAASLLDRKADLYRNRLAALKAQIQQQLPTNPANGAPHAHTHTHHHHEHDHEHEHEHHHHPLPTAAQIQASAEADWQQLGEQTERAAGHLDALAAVPKPTKGKVVRKRLEIAALRRTRERLLNGHGHH